MLFLIVKGEQYVRWLLSDTARRNHSDGAISDTTVKLRSRAAQFRILMDGKLFKSTLLVQCDRMLVQNDVVLVYFFEK